MKPIVAAVLAFISFSSPGFAGIENIDREITVVKYLKYQWGETGYSDSFLDRLKFFTTLSSALRNIEKDLILDSDEDGSGAIDTDMEYALFSSQNAAELASADRNGDGSIDSDEYYQVLSSIGPQGGIGEGLCEYLGTLASVVPLPLPLATVVRHCVGETD